MTPDKPAFFDGPFTVWDRRTGVTVKVLGLDVTTYQPSAGVHYMTDLASFTKNAAKLGPYRVKPTTTLQRVWAGDDPDNPAWTVSIVFPDQATADAVLAQLA